MIIHDVAVIIEKVLRKNGHLMKSTITILIVDDEPAIRMGLASTLGQHGYNVVTAIDGIEGLLKAKQTLPDLILSDVMMPDLNGFEMRKVMSAEPQLASIPFIFLTARSASGDKVTGIRNGADDYVTKPFETEELLARIEAVLRRVQAERERGREQALQVAQKEMENLRTEILRNFSHELRTPLGNVMMSLDMVVNHKFDTPEEQSDFLRIAYSSADRLEALVTDIILLSELDQNKINTMHQVIDVNYHILMPIKKRLSRYESKEIQFVHDISVTTPIRAPRREFTQALVHLLDNAFRFSPERGKVGLIIQSRETGGVSITVADQGKGIPLELREKVFERYYQASSGDSRAYEGLGVGLTIARAVISRLGGSVEIVDSEEGCCVMATLPVFPAEREKND